MSHYAARPRRRGLVERFLHAVLGSRVVVPAMAIYLPIYLLADLWWGVAAMWCAAVILSEIADLRDEIKK